MPPVKALWIGIGLIFVLAGLRTSPGEAQAIAPHRRDPLLRAVMFWMNGCPHCHFVLDEVLPPLQEKYDGRLQIQLVELASVEDIDRLYLAAATLSIPKDQVGVPFLMIGDRVLVGSDQISSELPGLIEQYLAYVETQAIQAVCGPVGDCNAVQTCVSIVRIMA